MKKTLLAIVTILFSLIVCLGAMEAALRLKNSNMRNYDIEMWRYSKLLKKLSPDKALGHEHIPGASAVLQSVNVRINERGLRGGPVPPRDPAVRRIVFLGGSVTFGWGVTEEDSVTVVTERLMREKGARVEVLNAGIGNYNAPRYVHLFLSRLTDLEPTDIVVHYFVSDAEELGEGHDNPLLRNSQLAATAWMGFMRLNNKFKETSLEQYYRAISDPGAPGHKAMVAGLKDLAAYAKTRGIRLYLAVTPDVRQLQDYKLSFVHDQLRELAAAEGYAYLDLLPALKGYSQEDIFAMPGDPHPNALGHARMAQALAEALQDPAPR